MTTVDAFLSPHSAPLAPHSSPLTLHPSLLTSHPHSSPSLLTLTPCSKQYMLGSEMLVAPQYSKSESAFYVRVFLPSGLDWVHVWTNVTYRGMWVWCGCGCVHVLCCAVLCCAVLCCVCANMPCKRTLLNLSHHIPRCLGGNSWVDVPSPLGKPCVLYRKGSSIGKQFQENVMNL